ncbi:hypothetical protein [Agrobacterium larrymoorei]|uniref:Uncharacterized protein n=1 Tax=Agrobacterium larrymoorei TaxID=160699 RepID=A0A4D7DU00_9HYPH|nr:hypothetical protein [Agrobacterium larrymoorei]QCJ00966.1 hypothetical protein CFBP5473_23595 [Agrobacterium larrymoorei]QYA10304.1 hypothetical protein J5285_22265 [Agrobacterium larrymoorei]
MGREDIPETSAQQSGWKRLNADSIRRISDFLIERDPRQTVENLTTLRSLDKNTKSAYDSSSEVLDALSRAAVLVERIYLCSIPEGGFDREFNREEIGTKASAGTRIEAIEGTLDLLSERRKSELVTHVLSLQDGYQQASAIEAFAPSVNKLTPTQKGRIIDKAFDYASNYSARGDAILIRAGVQALSYAHDDLNPQQRRHLQQIVNYNLMPEQWVIIKDITEGRSDYIASEGQSMDEDFAVSGAISLREKMSVIESRVEKVFENDASEFRTMRQLSSVQFVMANVLNSVYERRAQLNDRESTRGSGPCL